MEDRDIMRTTGHRVAESLRSYDRVTDDRHVAMGEAVLDRALGGNMTVVSALPLVSDDLKRTDQSTDAPLAVEFPKKVMEIDGDVPKVVCVVQPPSEPPSPRAQVNVLSQQFVDLNVNMQHPMPQSGTHAVQFAAMEAMKAFASAFGMSMTAAMGR